MTYLFGWWTPFVQFVLAVGLTFILIEIIAILDAATTIIRAMTKDIETASPNPPPEPPKSGD
jgi:hypothetical protein